MRVYIASESQIDKRLRLDKRKNSEAFCNSFNSENELPPKFFDLQDKIRDAIEKEFWKTFDDGIDRSQFKQWESGAMHSQFYFSAELIASERIIIEMSDEILGDKLIGLLMSFLEKCSSRYCVIGVVFRGMLTGSNYVGRFVINTDEIAVEESLVDIRTKQIRIMEVDK